MRDIFWGLALPVFLVVTLALAFVVNSWGWPVVWLWAAIGGGAVAMVFVVAGFIAPPSHSN